MTHVICIMMMYYYFEVNSRFKIHKIIDNTVVLMVVTVLMVVQCHQLNPSRLTESVIATCIASFFADNQELIIGAVLFELCTIVIFVCAVGLAPGTTEDGLRAEHIFKELFCH